MHRPHHPSSSGFRLVRPPLCLIAALAVGWAGLPGARAQGGARRPRAAQAAHPDRELAQPDRPRPVPPDAVTRQAIDLPGRSLHFTATAGFTRVFGEDGAPEADIGETASFFLKSAP